MTRPYCWGLDREGVRCQKLSWQLTGEILWIFQTGKGNSFTLLKNIRLCFLGAHAKISTDLDTLQDDMMYSQIHPYLPSWPLKITLVRVQRNPDRKLWSLILEDKRANSLEKSLILGKIEGKRWRGKQRMRWFNSITDSMDMNLSKFWKIVEERVA